MIKLIDFIQKNNKVYLLVAILLILNFIGFTLFSYHEFKLNSNTSGAEKEASDKLKNAEQSLNNVTNTYKLVKKIENRIQLFKNTELKNESYFESEMTKQIYDALGNNNINFQSISYGEKELLKGNIKKRPCHIPIKSSYANFRKLLVDLELLPFPTMIDKISISSVNSGEISATIDVVSYYKKGSNENIK